MAFTKIENADLNGIGVIGLPDQPGLSTAAMQAKFEETARSVVIPKHNGLIDELEDTTAAGNIGAVAPTGRTGATVQAILDDISAFEKIEAGGTTFTASGSDTFKINQGSNVTITALASPDKGIVISSAGGGGGSTGDMLMSEYDNSGDVKSASSTGNGIKDYVASAISGKADTSSLATVATSGSFNDLDDQPTIPTALSDLSDDATHRLVTDTDITAWNGKSAVSWSQTITTGQKIATVTINGTPTDVYAPTGGGGGGGSVDSVNGMQGTVILDVADINDVTVASLADGDVLAYDSSATKWKNKTLSIPTITDTYSGTSSDGMSGKAVKSAIDALDGVITGSAGTGKTLSAFSQTDGKVTATFSNISITKSQVSDFPTIPTVNDSTITIQKNGVTVDYFTTNAASAKNINIPMDKWFGTSATVSSGSVTFSGIDDSTGTNGYKPFAVVTSSSTNKNPTAQLSSISGEGTSSMSLTYTTDADEGATVYLRIIS